MTRRFRIAAALALALLAAAAGIYAWLWHRIAGEIAAGLPAWTAAMAADGVQVAHGPAVVAGFPFAFRVELPSPVIERPSGYPAVRWSGERLIGTARPWRLAEWTIAVPRPSRLVLAVGRDAWQASVATVEGTFVGGSAGSMLALAARNIAGMESDPLTIATATIRLAPEAGRANAIAAAIGVDGVRLPERAQPLLGRDIATIGGEGTLVERIPTLPPAAALEAWRAAGGNLDVTRFRLAWGAARADGAFTLALDAALQPILAGTADLAGHEAVLDALVGAGRIGRMEAFGLRALLNAVARPAADGGTPTVAAQFTVQDGRLSAGPVGGSSFRLLQLPRIAWPER